MSRKANDQDTIVQNANNLVTYWYLFYNYKFHGPGPIVKGWA